jgi:hypothetical protein
VGQHQVSMLEHAQPQAAGLAMASGGAPGDDDAGDALAT